ncbi:MAG: molybdate ABC transporter substrate-binding protein [Planctomycetota bacterium]|nr:molybdate ABC transporter substrate-binding protein [Planctomycetota bacterium]MDA1251218.1 molybdate ABC transporter substrate-binding protein [Planctomycetota bacterium]
MIRPRRPQSSLNFQANRLGRVNALWALLAGGTAIVAAMGVLLNFGGPERPPEGKSLTVFCAAGLRIPVEKIAEEYEKEYGVHIDLQYGGSNALLNQLQVNKFSDADLFLAADDFYTDAAHEQGLAKERMNIAWMRPVIAVAKDNESIKSIQDLLKPEIRVALGDPEAAAVGRAARKRLKSIAHGDSDLWTLLAANATENGVFKPTVNEIANDVRIGTVDAAIVWDSTVAMPKYKNDLKAIPVPELDGDPNLVTVSVLTSSKVPTAAIRFARYLSASNRGLKVFEENGTRPVDGDIWVEKPEITFFCGAVNRRAVEDVVQDFATREGVTVNTTYDGCGTLTGRMKIVEGQATDLGFPDVYMACDRYYLDNVKDWFQEDVDVSDTEIVLVVPKGSDKVKTLADLLKPGIRVSVGEADQCTLGALTRRLLASEELYEKLKAKQTADGEVVVEKASSALIIPDVTAGHVDAGIAYITDAKANAHKVDIIHIESKLNLAIQPFGIAKTSVHKYLVRRLFARVAASKDKFEKAGFHFRLGKDGKDKSSADEPATDQGTVSGKDAGQ